MARLLGRPFMPWQQHVADVAGEIDPDTGRLIYREVRLTVPRQSGKTTLVLAKNVHRMIDAQHFGGRQHLTYVAQTRDKAREKFVDDYIEDLKLVSKLRGHWKPRLSNGSESIRWKNGSRWGIESTTERAGHGSVLDVGDIDEAFAQIDARAEQAMKPAQITRPSPQLWIISTAGTDMSIYLNGKIDSGRKHVEEGLDRGVAYFEWSAPPGADPADPATWWACMPALGHTVTEDAVRSDFLSMDLAEFCRAYLNWRNNGDVGVQVIPAQAWADCLDEESELIGEPAFAIDITPKSTAAAIGCSGWRADGLAHVEVIDHRPGTSWFVRRVAEVTSRWSSLPVAYDPAGPVASLRSELEAAGVMLHPMSSRDMANACEGLLRDTGVPAGPDELAQPSRLRHIGQKPLDDAVKGAGTRVIGDGWAWRRRTSTADISPLVAITNARWNLLEHPQITSANVYVV